MPTTAQRFYLGTVDDDQAYGTTVKKNVETAPAANSTTTNTWTSTTAATRTHVPLTGSTTASDTSDANGWAFNNGGTDGLGSAAGAERWIKAGTWAFSMSYTLNAPALLATIACTVTARVYRVSAAGTRTLLFTAASGNFSATGVIAWNSAAQPEYVLGPGEVIHVGFTAVSAATANALNQVTNTVLTLNLGASSYFDVPAPGIRTLARADYAFTGLGTAAVVSGKVLAATYAFTGTGTLSAIGNAIFSSVYTFAGLGQAAVQGSSVAGTVFAATGTGTLTGRPSKVLGTTYAMDSGNPEAGGEPPVTVVRPLFVFDD